VSVTALRDAQEAIIGYLLIGTDNTARKHAEEALREAEAMQTAVFNSIVDVTTAVAKGDLSKKITVDVRGEFLELKNTINTMVDQPGSFARSDASRRRLAPKASSAARRTSASRDVERPHRQRQLHGEQLTSQVRNITVTTAVANGDLSRKITVDVRGEMLVSRTPSTPWSTSWLLRQVTRVAQMNGTETAGRRGPRGRRTWKTHRQPELHAS
jgi:HAMP domain-containing protein